MTIDEMDEAFGELVKWMSPSNYKNGFDLTENQYKYVASHGDGFGKMTIEQMDALGITFDWSHIRDSSDEAIKEMHMALGRVISNMVVVDDDIEWDQAERDAWSQ